MTLAIFVVVYAGMILGRVPRLGLDRAGIALLGAIALLATGQVTLDRAIEMVDVPTLALLFGMMVLSAQIRLGGVYATLTGRAASKAHSPGVLLGIVIAVVAPLAAVFTNDVVALAVTPIVIDLARVRRLDPVPLLLAVACAANVGSAATLVGNPQNILIGQTLSLSFVQYLMRAAPPAAVGLAAVWALIAWLYRGRWESTHAAEGISGDAPAWSSWQATKGLGLAALAMTAFLIGAWPREIVALSAAALVLMSRRFHSRQMLGLVDWQLLVLFVGLFIVNGALADSGAVARAARGLTEAGIDLRRAPYLFVSCVALSNAVSNVPAVMLLLPFAEGGREGALLALSSTLAGNLVIVGSIANIIVVEQAARRGVTISWRTHARVGVPVTLATLVIAALALAV